MFVELFLHRLDALCFVVVSVSVVEMVSVWMNIPSNYTTLHYTLTHFTNSTTHQEEGSVGGESSQQRRPNAGVKPQKAPLS